MKPFHLLVIGAVLAVGALLYIAFDDAGERQQQRTGLDRSSDRRPGRGDADGAAGGGEAGAEGDEARGLEATLTVLAPDGEPAAGATLAVHGAYDSAATAGADGVARLALRPGFYSVVATLGDATGSISFELKEPADLGTLQLRASVAIRGTVYDAKGKPLPGAVVEAVTSLPMRGWSLGRLVQRMTSPEQIAARTTTGPDGAYELRVGKGGSFALRVIARGFAQETEPGRAYSTDVEGLDFYLFTGTTVSGVVLTEAGAPVPAANVLVVDPQQIFAQRIPKAETVTRADGSFELALMPSRQMVLVARAPGFAANMQQLTMPARDLEIRLARGVTVRLRTVEEGTGKAAPAIGVALNYKGGFKVGETDENGELVLENMPVEGPRGWGSQQQLFLWGGGFVSKLERIGDKEIVAGVLDIGDVELAPGGVVRGRVFDEESGEPVAGAEVRTWGGLDVQLQWLDPSRTLSAKDGTFELTGVPLGATIVTADHPDYVGPFDPTTFFSGMRGGDPIFPDGETKLRRDIPLVPAAFVTGVVLGPDGAPVAGARVATVEEGQSAFLKVLTGRTTEAFSDAEGRFRLALEPKKTVKLRAMHRAFGASPSVALTPGGTAPVTLELAQPIEIRGKVVDTADEPVAGVRVTVTREEDDNPSPNPLAALRNDGVTARPAVTNDAGEYVIRNAPEGELFLTFDHPDYRLRKEPIRTVAGAPVDARKAVLDKGAGVAGVVVDEAGEPVASVNVNATVNFGAQPDGEPGRTWANTTSGPDGEFEVSGLRDGQVTVRVYRDGSYCRPVTVPAGTIGVRLVVAEAGKLRGRVTAGGRPVANANINAQLEGADPSPGAAQSRFLAWARTDADGTFTLEPLPPRAPFRLVINHQSYQATTIRGVTAAGERVRDFTIDPGIQVGGVVVDERNEPVPNVTLIVKHGEGKRQWVRSGDDGRWSVGGLEPGPVTVEIGRGAFIRTEPLPVAPGATDVRLVAARGERIAGTVRFADGSDLRVRIDALDADDKVVNSSWAWPQNRNFSVVGLPRGTYTIRVAELVDAAAEPGRQPEQKVLAVFPDIRSGTENLTIDLR